MNKRRLTSIVIKEGRIKDFRQLVNVCASIAKRKEKTHEDIPIKEIIFCPRTGVYVALYEIPLSSRRIVSPGVRGKKGSSK